MSPLRPIVAKRSSVKPALKSSSMKKASSPSRSAGMTASRATKRRHGTNQLLRSPFARNLTAQEFPYRHRNGNLPVVLRICSGKETIKPSGKHLYLHAGFKPGHIYEFIYAAKNPSVLGLGFAAVRDLVSFLPLPKEGLGWPPQPVANRRKNFWHPVRLWLGPLAERPIPPRPGFSRLQ